ncbi:response regulator [Herbaspirillum rhizosphaerae]|uniref:response regulator n=1 Tax=Herbaspirillum rhizosphaerae TaxID=346179 RepID=UPI00067AEBCB|nr:response regulator [Herbaspirillum rhizosphaerae]
MTVSDPAILIIEDDEGLRMLARRRLEKRGYTVGSAGSIAQARSLLRDGGFDLLVIDYQLDDNMSGLDFYNELRDQGVDIPAVMCSGFSDDAHVSEALRCGIAHVLPKTQDYLDELADLVKQVLQQQAGAAD